MISARAINRIAIAIGVTALAFLVYKVGWRTLLDQLIAFGPAFPVILGISAISNAAASVGWYYTFDPADRPSLGRTVLISFASQALGGALPTGQGGSLAKGNMMRGLTRGTQIVSSLVLYNYVHLLATLAVVVVGPLWALQAGGFPPAITSLTLAVTAAVLVGAILLGLLLYAGKLHWILVQLREGRLPVNPGPRLIERTRNVDEGLRGFLRDRPGDLFRALVALSLSRALLVPEAYVILSRMEVSDSWLVAAMVFSTTQMVNYMLKILPAREGFLEASTLGVFELLGMRGADGLALEITRRLRKVFFQALGIGLMFVVNRREAPGG